MGGRGVSIIAAFQSRAQLISKWGPSAAAEIVNNAGGLLIYGGTTDRDDLQYWSTVLGERDEVVEHRGPDGAVTGYSTRSVPVFPPSRLRSLPEAHAIAVRRHIDPVVGRPGAVWQRSRASRLGTLLGSLRLRRRRVVAEPVSLAVATGRDAHGSRDRAKGRPPLPVASGVAGDVTGPAGE